MKRNSAALLLLLLPLTVMADTWSLPQLLARLAAVEERRAEYHETRHLALLDVPLESRGTLIFRAPDYLEKQVDAEGGSYRVRGEQLLLQQNGERRSLSLEELPALAAFVASIRATLAGDQQTLERYYHVRLQGGPDAWNLQLEPLQTEMAALIESITLRGSGERISSVVTVARGGDMTTMQLSEGDGR